METKVAAIYARKSTAQDVGDDAKSVTRQVENAKAFAAAQGWAVDDRFIFIDDGVSGAETRKLVEKQRMIDSIVSGRCPFHVLVMQSNDRLSRRDGDEALSELKSLAAHVEVWFYAEQARFTSGTFESNVTGFLRGEFAAQFRRAIAQKTHEAMLRKAKAGYVTGGRVFGYDNVRQHGNVVRRINPTEAAVVVDIYTRYANGEGFKQIAHALNARQVVSPRAQRGRPCGWEPSTVRAVLTRSIYQGVVTYNKTTKRDPNGSRWHHRQLPKAETEWVQVDAPQLRIIDADLALAVETKLAGRRHAYLRGMKGQLLGRPVEGRHLLAGFLLCQCGSRFEAVKSKGGTHVYVCSARRRKGPDVCPSDVSIPLGDIEPTFLDVIEGTVLHPDFIDRVIEAVFANEPDAERDGWKRERQRLATEVTNLTTAIAAGGDIPALVKELQKRDKELKALDVKLARPVLAMPEREGLREALRLRGGQWRDVLRGPHVAQARLVLQHLIELPIQIRWDHNTPPKWATKSRPGGLLAGLIQNVASPSGIEPESRP